MSMGQVVKRSLDKYDVDINERLFRVGSARLLVATSFVNNEPAANLTQGRAIETSAGCY